MQGGCHRQHALTVNYRWNLMQCVHSVAVTVTPKLPAHDGAALRIKAQGLLFERKIVFSLVMSG
jgi:hypothetical protein